MATFAPSAASRLRIAAPMPRAPPVINAIFPSSFLFMICLLLVSRLNSFCIDWYKKIGLDKRLSNDLFTYRYEIRHHRAPWTPSRLRSGRGPGSRHARFLGQGVRRRFTLQSSTGHANQSTKSL